MVSRSGNINVLPVLWCKAGGRIMGPDVVWVHKSEEVSIHCLLSVQTHCKRVDWWLAV